MPTTLLLRFPWGRYHANPWGRHVNEGAVEVPPSPWRLLRALCAVWQTRTPELDETVVHPLLARLAEPPAFHVPRHGVSHTRHYYPDSTHRTGSVSPDRTLDAFAVFERDAELAAVWPFDLSPEQHAALERLAAALPYLGRADSVCFGSVPMSWQPTAHEEWIPVDVADTVEPHAEATAVLAAELPLRVDTLLVRPVDVRRGGLLFPAGSHFVGYQRLPDAPAARLRHTHRFERPTAVRFSVLQPGLPPETDAVVYTDLLRQAALSKLGGLREEKEHTLLGGKTVDGAALTGHRHAHFLALARERRLTDLLVWVPAGLPEDEFTALAAVQRLCSPQRESWRLVVRMSGHGEVGAIAPELSRRSAVWRSVTPFTPARYPKRNTHWLGFLADEVSRELVGRGMPEPKSVRPLEDDDGRAFVRFRPSRRFSRGSDQGRANRPPCRLRLEFQEPVAGPLALGHLSHFGLGLFVPETGG